MRGQADAVVRDGDADRAVAPADARYLYLPRLGVLTGVGE